MIEERMKAEVVLAIAIRRAKSFDRCLLQVKQEKVKRLGFAV
jgi:hypothetical protein